MKTRLRIAATSLCAALSVCAVPHAAAQSFPAKPVQMIVPYTAGGGADVVMRGVAQRLAETWGRNVVIDNRAGASGMIGTELAAKSAPDGYTLLGHTSSYPATAAIREKLPFDPARAIVPVAAVAKTPLVIVLHPSVPANSVKELIALARAGPGRLNYASSGIGAPPHLAGEMFDTLANVKMTHVAYKGDTPAIADLLGGHVDLAFLAVSATSPHIKAGKLKALAVTSAQRTPVMPDLPTIAEAGGLKEFDISTWWGLLAPAGTPAEAVQKMSGTMGRIAAMPEIKSRFAELGVEAAADTPEQFGAFIRSEIQKFARLAKLAGVKPE